MLKHDEFEAHSYVNHEAHTVEAQHSTEREHNWNNGNGAIKLKKRNFVENKNILIN
jgi:hypothetical protein